MGVRRMGVRMGVSLFCMYCMCMCVCMCVLYPCRVQLSRAIVNLLLVDLWLHSEPVPLIFTVSIDRAPV